MKKNEWKPFPEFSQIFDDVEEHPIFNKLYTNFIKETLSKNGLVLKV